jgi:hypothetical protein
MPSTVDRYRYLNVLVYAKGGNIIFERGREDVVFRSV